MKQKIKTALISVSDKTDISDILKTLDKYKVKIISSGGTYRFIKKLGYGKINYIKFPNGLKNKYQHYTKANISKLLKIGYKNDIKDLENGISGYLKLFKSL